MAKSKYEQIYKELKEKINNHVYEEGAYLPSENTLIQEYGCSRNTVRRAISHLVMDGDVQPRHGKGVRVIHSAAAYNQGYDMLATGMEGFSTTAKKHGFSIKTKVITFQEMVVDEKLSRQTGFPEGKEVYFIQRVRFLNGVARMVDTNYIRKDIVTGLTKEQARISLFEYFTNALGIELTTIKRRITVEHSTPLDERYLSLGEYNCVAVMTSRCFNQDGIQFEFSQAHNRPDIFVFNSVTSKSLMPNL